MRDLVESVLECGNLVGLEISSAQMTMFFCGFQCGCVVRAERWRASKVASCGICATPFERRWSDGLNDTNVNGSPQPGQVGPSFADERRMGTVHSINSRSGSLSCIVCRMTARSASRFVFDARDKIRSDELAGDLAATRAAFSL